jgi:hypothetical protein
VGGSFGHCVRVVRPAAASGTAGAAHDEHLLPLPDEQVRQRRADRTLAEDHVTRHEPISLMSDCERCSLL